MPMIRPMFGIETEYAISAFRPDGKGLALAPLLDRLMEEARVRLVHLPDRNEGMFLGNSLRLYVDAGNHPEICTPECADPADAVRYVRAGDAILAKLVAAIEGRRGVGEIFVTRCNVDYGNGEASWGSHESYLYRNTEDIAEQLIPHLVTRIVFTGAGGFNNLCQNGLQPAISPRAWHLRTEVGSASQYSRPLVHSKDERHAAEGYHRLHLICGESTCSDIALWLRVGTTALVIALIDAGVRPGDAVRLRAPVEAIRAISSDPGATTPLRTRQASRTAGDIQRHYLEQVESRIGERWMPPFAESVCREWRRVLDQLEEGPQAVSPRLDWAIKHSMYSRLLEREGTDWNTVACWNWLMESGLSRFARASSEERPASLPELLSRDRRLSVPRAWVQESSGRSHLTWEDVDRFLHLRDRLCEIDVRFSQIGPSGIFAQLDQAAVLDHAAPGADDVEAATTQPPSGTRAALRARFIRKLARHPERYRADWTGIWDYQDQRWINLTDPFARSAEWKPMAKPSPPPDLPQEFLDMLRRRRPG